MFSSPDAIGEQHSVIGIVDGNDWNGLAFEREFGVWIVKWDGGCKEAGILDADVTAEKSRDGTRRNPSAKGMSDKCQPFTFFLW